jgi:phosphoenolpyruvate synthase/pyruvate phosphate dikinase
MAIKFAFDRKDMYIYPWYISDLAATKDIKKIYGVKIKKTSVLIEGGFFKMGYDFESTNQTGERIFKKILNNENYFKLAIKRIYHYSDELIKFSNKVEENKSIKNYSNKDLLFIYEQYIKKLRSLRAWGWMPVFLDGIYKNFLTDYIQSEFKKLLEKKNKSEKFSDYYTLLSSAEKESEVQLEELARLNLIAEILKNKKSQKIIKSIKSGDMKKIKIQSLDVYCLIKRHLRDFGWLTYAYSGPTMKVEHLIALIKENLEKGNISVQIKEIVNHYNKLPKEKIKIAKSINLSSKLGYLFNVSSELMYIKDYRKGIYQKSYVAMDKVMKEIAKRIGISLKESKYLLIGEIKEALLKNKKAYYQKIVLERLKKCCYVAKNGKIEVFQGKECNKIIKKYDFSNKIEDIDSKEIKGMVAFKGETRGIVKIVLTSKDVKKVNKGDILVSSATNPDLILAMKKAGAIVTDTGGIISHAAIVSRELKKPCIIGTKNATHILKDGDKVFVDANKGIVKILKKKSE